MRAMLIVPMPERCLDCRFGLINPQEKNYACLATAKFMEEFPDARPEWCPLLEVAHVEEVETDA